MPSQYLVYFLYLVFERPMPDFTHEYLKLVYAPSEPALFCFAAYLVIPFTISGAKVSKTEKIYRF